MTDLWTEATLDHEALAREAALARVDAELESVLPFLLAARTDAEYGHRRALAEGRLEAIALRHGLDPAEVLATADRRFSIFTEALAEGVDPVENLVSSTRGGSGPEERLEHHEGPDFSGGYSEVPRGDLEHVADDVVRPVTTGNEPQEWFQPVSRDQAAVPPPPAPTLDHEIEHTGKRKKAKRKTARKKIRKKAQGGAQPGDYMATTPPDLGTGSGSQDIGVSGPAGPPSVPAGMLPAGAVAVPGTTPVQQRQVTSSRDPVRAQVLAVTASVRAANPWLPEHEASRIAREAVGRYFAATDWSPTQWDDSPPRQSDGGGGGGGGGTGPAGHVLEWQGLKSMMPGGGGGGAGGAAGELGEAAELAAL